MSRADITTAAGRVLFGGRVVLIGFDSFALLEKALNIRSAPAAAATCPVALAQLTDDTRFFHANEIDYFTFANVKAETKLVVQFHIVSVGTF